MIDNHKQAITLLEVFAGCIESKTLPGKGSPAHQKIVEIINASGMASRKHRIPSPSKQAKAIQGMLSALQVIHTWAKFQDGQELVPEHVAKLTQKAIKAFNDSRVITKP